MTRLKKDERFDQEKAVEAMPMELQEIGQALVALARGDKCELEPYLKCVEANADISGSSGKLHCHVIQLDGNGRVRLKDMMKGIACALVDYAIPRSRIRKAFEHFQLTGSTSQVVSLAQQAKDVFVDAANTGEGGEILLFLFAEKYLKLPQILCKMNLKTSGNVHFHGSDGIHVSTNETGGLDLYWSESKIYKDLGSGISACLGSISTVLTSDTAAESRDLQLVGDYMDLDSPQLESAIKEFLNPSSEAFNSVRFCGLCLVGFDSEHYPTKPNEKFLDQVLLDAKKSLPDWKVAISNGLCTHKIESYNVHVFCLPVPSAEDFRSEFLKSIGK